MCVVPPVLADMSFKKRGATTVYEVRESHGPISIFKFLVFDRVFNILLTNISIRGEDACVVAPVFGFCFVHRWYFISEFETQLWIGARLCFNFPVFVFFDIKLTSHFPTKDYLCSPNYICISLRWSFIFRLRLFQNLTMHGVGWLIEM